MNLQVNIQGYFDMVFLSKDGERLDKVEEKRIHDKLVDGIYSIGFDSKGVYNEYFELVAQFRLYVTNDVGYEFEVED
jgi:hypothetical protein